MRKRCFLCGQPYFEDDLHEVVSAEGLIEICTSCYWDTEECPECGRQVVPEEEGICPLCRMKL